MNYASFAKVFVESMRKLKAMLRSIKVFMDSTVANEMHGMLHNPRSRSASSSSSRPTIQTEESFFQSLIEVRKDV